MLSWFGDEGSVSVREGASAAGVAGLEAARAELEAVLGDNALWQALNASADPVARERWQLELEGDPVYRSWRALGAAIEGLRSRESKEPFRGQIGLADILEKIRKDAAAAPDTTAEAETAVPEPAMEQPGQPPLEEPRQDQATALSATGASPLSQPAADAIPAVAPPAAQRPAIPMVAASSHVNTSAAERVKRLQDERRKLNAARGISSDDDEEATVSFVIRERSEPPTASAAPAVTTAPARATQPARHARRNEGYVQHHARAEEAEVVVVKHGDNGARIVESHLAERGPAHRPPRPLTRD